MKKTYEKPDLQISRIVVEEPIMFFGPMGDNIIDPGFGYGNLSGGLEGFDEGERER